MSSRIQPHDVVAGMRWLDLVMLTSRGADSKIFPRSLILPEEQQIEEIWVDLSSLPILYFQNQEGYTTLKVAGKPPDIYLPAMYRQALGLHIATYQTRGVENLCSRFCIRESLVDLWPWVVV